MGGGDRGLQLERARSSPRSRALEDAQAFGDLAVSQRERS